MGARDLLNDLASAGLSVYVHGGNLIIRPRELLTNEIRAAIKAFKLDLLALLMAPPIADKQTSENQSREARDASGALLRRLRGAGLDTDAAEEARDWIRSRAGDADDRRLCIECAHFGERGKVCRHPDLIAIQAPRDLGRLAVTPQRCDGFSDARP
jgi:hypothetical protein